MQTKVEICGVNTSGLPVLSAKKTDELLRSAAAGDRQARDELIRGNLRLVLSVVQRFQGRGESPDDLFQVGCIGLMKSIDHFNTELGVRFSTYAVPMNVDWGKSPSAINQQRTGLHTQHKRRIRCYFVILICWMSSLRCGADSMSV